MALESKQLVDISIVLVLDIFFLSIIFTNSESQHIAYCFAWGFYHFTCLPILEGAIIRITNYDYENISVLLNGGNQVDCVMQNKLKNTINNKRKEMLIRKL